MTKTETKRFVLQAMDPATGCPTDEVVFGVLDLLDLGAIIGSLETDTQCDYDLEPSEVAEIIQRFGVKFDSKGLPVQLRRWHAVDELPYRVHTRRELALMLRKLKPLAVFDFPSDEEFIEGEYFEQHVSSGEFVKRELDVPLLLQSRGESRNLIYRYVLYARPSEEWRVDAYIFLTFARLYEGWSPAIEWMEGLLLGYEGWQNDIHIAAMKLAQKNKTTAPGL